MKTKGFPETPGLYIAQRDCDVILIKITGMYPTLEVGKTVYLTSLISGNTIKEAPKEAVCNMITFSEKWSFSKVEDVDIRVFPKTSFKVDGNLDLSTDDIILMRNTYYRMIQCGISSSKIIKSLVYEYKTTIDQILTLINKFDRESHHVV